MAVVSLKKRSVLSSLIWSNFQKRTFSGLSFPGLQNQVFKLALHRPKTPIQWLLFLSRNVFRAIVSKASKTRFLSSHFTGPGLSFPRPSKPLLQARASQAQAFHSKPFVSLKKRSVLGSLVWSNLPKRTFSGLSFPRPPKPSFQASASQAQAPIQRLLFLSRNAQY